MKLHKETQAYQRPEAYLLALFFMGLALIDLIRLIRYPETPFGLLLAGDVVVLLLSAGALYLLWRVRMDLSISEKSIKYRIHPFHAHKHKIRWEDVEAASVVELPYGRSLSGWDVHFNLLERRISLCGYNGLSLRLKNGEQVLLGSRNTDALRSALHSIEEKGG